VVLLQEVAVMKRHLRLVPPLGQEAPQQERVVQSLVPVRVRALAQQLGLAQRLVLELEEELAQGLEQGLQLPQVLVQDLKLVQVDSQALGLVLARVAILAQILEQEQV
jgi:hypothetical protein